MAKMVSSQKAPKPLTILLRRKKKKRSKSRDGSRNLLELVKDPEAFYVIERLLDKRITEDNREEYLVKWRGWPSDWDSWEPREELEINANAMINEYNRIPEPSSTEVKHCICQQPYRFENGGMIQCAYCIQWFHFDCLNISLIDANRIEEFYCQRCRDHNPKLDAKMRENEAKESASPRYLWRRKI